MSLDFDEPSPNNGYSRRVIVTDIKMPFMSMVTFMVKWSLAAIPASLILMTIWTIFFLFVAGIFSALGITLTALGKK